MHTKDGTMWIKLFRSGDYTVWHTATIPSLYQITKNGKPPTNDAGYHDLGALLKLKGIVLANIY